MYLKIPKWVLMAVLRICDGRQIVIAEGSHMVCGWLIRNLGPVALLVDYVWYTGDRHMVHHFHFRFFNRQYDIGYFMQDFEWPLFEGNWREQCLG